MTLDPVVQELVDRAALHDLMVNYFRAVDRRDLDLLRTLFTPDTYVEFSTGTRCTGVEEMAALVKSLERHELTMHFMGNHRMEIYGDMANMSTNAIDFFRYTEDGKKYDRWGGLRYVDRVVRRDGRWQIYFRVGIIDWRRVDAVVSPDAPITPPFRR